VSTPEPDSDNVGWDEVAKHLIDPQDCKKPVIFDVQTAAKRQLESAALLWFLEADIGSVYALAVAAQELIDNTKKKLTKWRSLSQKAEINPWSPAMQNFLKVRQSFLKHGPDRNRKGKHSVDLDPSDVGVVLFSAIGSYVLFYHKATPLMKVFGARYTLERPSILPPDQTAGSFLIDGVSVDDLLGICRSEFVIQALARTGDAIRKRKGANPEK
jgi:hypothetical protein